MGLGMSDCPLNPDLEFTPIDQPGKTVMGGLVAKLPVFF